MSFRPRFSYFERNDNLGMCVIQDILHFALEDGAFSSNRIQEPADIWRYTDVSPHRKSVPIHIKKEMEHIPVFRRAARDKRGHWITHPTEFLTYEQFCEDEHRLQRAFGMKEDGSSYRYRKGSAAIASQLPSMICLSRNR